ncbi:MAG: hypothetical protein HUJ25_04595 [Crocinitomicaceae bacterium]|nr:hypothetical protein [Crocinitomicaceae bacterium]
MACYICDKEKFSVEHAPAKCFFPKDKRVNLITVDSCKEHNEDTSKDDEYVRNIIAMTIGNNDVAINHFLTQCLKSFKHSPGLLKTTTKEQQQVFYSDNNSAKGEIKPTVAFGIDRLRIDQVMRKMAYALYYHKFNERWNRELNTGTEHLREKSMKADPMGLLIQESKKEIGEIPFEGTNPEVFQYAFLRSESEDLNEQILIMKFYEGFEMWMFPIPNTNGPVI